MCLTQTVPSTLYFATWSGWLTLRTPPLLSVFPSHPIPPSSSCVSNSFPLYLQPRANVVVPSAEWVSRVTPRREDDTTVMMRLLISRLIRLVQIDFPPSSYGSAVLIFLPILPTAPPVHVLILKTALVVVHTIQICARPCMQRHEVVIRSPSSLSPVHKEGRIHTTQAS